MNGANGHGTPDGVTLSGVPISYLESYPFPAFVLVVKLEHPQRPRFASRDTDITVLVSDNEEAVSPLSGPETWLSRSSVNTLGLTGPESDPMAWANEKWVQIAEGRPLAECTDQETLHSLGSWVNSGHEYPNENSIFVLQLGHSSVTLQLVKALVPLSPPSSTHAFCVVTSIQMPDNSANLWGRSSMSSDYTAPSNMRSSVTSSTLSPPLIDAPRSERRIKPKQVRSSYFDRSLFAEQMHQGLAECRQLVEQIDWSKTSIGPRSQWPQAIETVLSIAFTSVTQDSVWIGDELHLLYNQNYSTIVDHPTTFGRPVKEVWAPIWDQLKPMVDRCLNGEPVYHENDLLLYRRHGKGHFMEKYHTWSYLPIIDHGGHIIGIYNPTIETTDQVLAQRRMETTRQMSEQALVARTSREFFDSITDVLEQNPADAPFVICYSVDEKETQNGSTLVDLKLEATVGVPSNHPVAPPEMSLSLGAKPRSAFGLNVDRLSSPTLSAISALSSGSARIHHSFDRASWPIAKALATRQCVVIDNCSDLIQGFSVRQWDELPDSAIVIPIGSEASNDTPQAVMILGLNLLRPLDSEYEEWIQVMRAHLTSSYGSVKAHEAEAERRLERDKLERAKTAWFQGAAHDLRAPLALIVGPLDDVLRSNLSTKQKQNVTLAQRNVQRLQRLVNALLDFSRIEAGRLEGRFVPTDLGVFVTDLANLFRPAIERLHIEFKLEVMHREELVYIDPVLIETLVTNLLSNSLKYTEEGTITVRVTYSEYAEISVIDTGFGIPVAELDYVTDRYHRAQTALNRGAEGTGIGLALAKEIIRLHGGKFIISSQTSEESGLAHGSVFTAQLPLTVKEVSTAVFSPVAFGTYGKQVAKEVMHWRRDEDAENSSRSSDTGNESGNGTSNSGISDGFMFEKTDVLLVVDDSGDMRDYIRQMFSPFCKVIEASNGEEALAKAIASPPNLILSDLMMPKLSGQELLVAIRNEPKTRIVPLVLLSAATDDEARLAALIAGAEDFLSKPFKPKELLARVHLHMQMGKKRAKLETLFAEREQEMTVLSDFCPSGIMRTDAEGNLIYMNDAFREPAGMTRNDEFISWRAHCSEETWAHLQPIWDDILHGEREMTNATWKWDTGRSMSGVFIRLDKIRPGMSGIIACVTDISYQEEKLIEAERRRVEAEESKHQQELLVDLTSHEIRTPVSAILQCSSLVKENLVALKEQLRFAGVNGFHASQELLTDLEEDVEALESIYQCGLVQERIAGDVLSLARIQLDMLSLHDIEMDLRREARKVLSVFSSEAKMKNIDLVLEIGATLTDTGVSSLKTDPVRLGQVVTNLVSNAIRFTASSAIRRITVRFDTAWIPPTDDSCALPTVSGASAPPDSPVPEDTPVWLYVSVRDTGPGLGPKEKDILFQRFRQGNKMIHTRYGGSGLGLFICKKITELLGGRIEVTSQLGEGSVFRFFIKSRTVASPSALAALVAATSLGPLAPSMTTTGTNSTVTSVLLTSSSASSLPSPVSSAPESRSEILNVLVVEDNVINQTVLKRQILKAGFTCDVANNGQEALAHLHEAHRQSRRGAGPNRKRQYDVVLMDLEMPVMDGLTAIGYIREAEKSGVLLPQLVIALTGNARQGQIDQAFAAGMDDVVIKPYKLPDLIAKMRQAVAARRAAQLSDE